MTEQSPQFSISELRRKHPRFIYESYSWQIKDNNLVVSFNFKTEPNITFNPSITINSINYSKLKELRKDVVENLVFNLGLVEMISYWKATCSPIIEIKPNGLDEKQIAWWKDLIINGLGEFFFVNQIDFRGSEFLTIETNKPLSNNSQSYDNSAKEKGNLVLTSGGKDTALTLSILQDEEKDFGSILLNPTKAAFELAAICGAKESVIVERKIEPKLLELNKSGFLNGHTPFSSYLGFLSVLTAVLFGYKNVLVSNERSSNEGNTSFLGKEINHQYTKTLEFEQKFQKYVSDYLSCNVKYFSFLRPLYEIQIAAMLTNYNRVLGVFRSCNRNYKENSWCGNCPKCLAVYVMIFPFLKNNTIESIFEKEPFECEDNIKIVIDLIGLGTHKPFECVGTHEETVIGLFLGLEKAKEQYGELPKVWKYIEDNKILDNFRNLADKTREILTDWDKHHSIPQDFGDLLKKYYQKNLAEKYAAN